MSVETASARPGGHGFHGGGMHRGFVRHGGFRHGHWGHWRHRRYGWAVYGAPLLVGAAAYVPECYYVRRFGALYKVCN